MNKVRPIDPNTLSYQNISPEDTVLFDSFEVTSLFSPNKDIVEYYVYDLNNELIYQDLNFTNWTNTEDPSLASTTFDINATGSTQDSVTAPNTAQISTINLDPIQDLQNVGFDFGKVKPVYNFITYRLNSNPNNQYFISDISSDRTELRLKSNFISDDSLQISFEQFQNDFLSSPEFDEFYLNFGNNKYVVAVNTVLDNTVNPFSILIKLYEPLPQEFGVKSTCYVVTKNGESVAYEVEFEDVLNLTDTSIPIGPANINLELLNQISPATNYKSYDEITATDLSGSYNQLINFLSGSNIGIDINVDYSDYSNFVFFSSAQQRLNNFVTKLTNISASQADLNLIYSNITGSTSGSTVVLSNKVLLEKQIEDEISTFDPYEQYLYYQSGSYTWPKSNSTLPYVLYDVNSATGQAWYDTQSVTASNYDANNQNYLYWLVPEYLRTNDNNNYFLFIDMVGQLFDQMWLYTNAVTDKLEAYPGLNLGVSKDIIADVVESLGMKLYSSNFTAENIYNSLIGLSPTGSILLPTGSKLVTTYVTSSTEEQYIPTIDDYHKLTYKKIYHALPYLLKTKGTVNGVKTLLNIFGVPDTILRVNEYGGKDKNINTWDSWQDEFNYAYFTSGSYFVSSSFILNSVWGTENNRPQAVEFRFQPTNIPTNTGYYSQSLWSTNDGAGSGVSLILRYTGSAYSSGSYSGSIPNNYNHYALLEFIPDIANTTVSASIYLPFYDGGWWSVLINKDNNNPNYTLFAKNKLYSGSNGNIIGFQASSSVTASTENPWKNSSLSYFGTASLGPTSKIFSGSFQEIRYYSKALGENAFDAYVMNPYSIEEDNYLAFRAPLGGELYTGSTSIHPKVTGSWVATSSFTSNSNFYVSNTSSFNVNREFIFFDQFAVGIQNNISNKIDDQNIILPFYDITFNNIPNNTVLSSTVTIQQNFPVSQSYTENVNYAEIALSPQNEINEDINSSIGFFNIGELIGDPRQISSSALTYPDLDALRDIYFEKYESNYNWVDYINLISYFDNSLFKMLVDFVPARTALASGIVIKQTLLERNKYPVPQVDTFTTTSYYGSGSQPTTSWNTPIGTQNILFSGSLLTTLVTGSSGGSVPEMGGLTSSLGPGFNIIPITQSWSGTTPSLSGSIPFTSSYQYEFFNGEFSGSNVVVTNGNLSDCYVELVSVFTTASIPLPGAFSPEFQLKTYDLNIENTYYLSFTISNDASATGLGGGRIYYYDENGNDQTIYYIDDLAAGASITIDKLEISNILGNIPSNTNKQTKPVMFNVPLNFYSAGTIFGIPTLTNFTIYKAQLNDLDGDCEPLLNNVLANRPNPYYMDLDFSTNPYIAVNTQTVLSGSATRFAIPQSDYTSLKHANPRYFGSTTISPDFGQAIFKNPAQLPFNNKSQVLSNTNLYQNLRNGDLNPTNLFNTGSQLPNVENYSRYFCYFNTITTSSPEYPSGSNLNLVYIIDENGRAYGLSNQNSDSQQINDYLYIISNLYPSNSNPYIIPISGSNVSTSNLISNFPVIEGGAKYQTVCSLTGSGGGFVVPYTLNSSTGLYSNPGAAGTWFNSGSVSTLRDSYGAGIGTNTGFLEVFLTSSISNEPIALLQPSAGLNIFNKNTLTYISSSNTCSYTDTLFPLQYGDFIRFGNYSGSINKAPFSSSLDYNFNGAGLVNILSSSISVGSITTNTGGSTLNITPYITNSINSVQTQLLGFDNLIRQNYRIFRRIPTQTNVLIGTMITGLTEGFLIPENYNPNLNPTELAKIAGII